MQIRKNLLVFLMVSGLVLAGCASHKTPSVSLLGTTWVLTGLQGQKPLAGYPVTLEFSDGRINGSDGCNSYGGSVTLNGDKISVGNDIISTMMACQGPIMQQAPVFYAALKGAATYRIAGQQLTLLDAGGKTLATFTQQTDETNAIATASAGGSKGIVTPLPAATDIPVTPTEAPAAPSIANALPNAAYPLEGTSTGLAQLKDGVFEESAAPGSASKIHVQLGELQAFGDLNGDGSEDAAVLLVVDSGGSGTFTYLAAVLDDQGVARPVASTLLGDRIVVKSIAIQSGNIVVDTLTRQPDQPMSAAPTVEQTRTFQLRGDLLLEVLNQ